MKETKYAGYFADEEGNIYSARANKGHLFKEKAKGISNSGYQYVSINNKVVYVHRLIAETFIPNPENKPQVNHKDMNKLNNCVENLEWVTQVENMNHLKDNNPCTGKTKSNSGHLFKNENIIDHFRSLQKAKEYCHQKYNCTLCTIGRKNVNWENGLIYVRDDDFSGFDIKEFWEKRKDELKDLECKQKTLNKLYRGFKGKLYYNDIYVKDFNSVREASDYIGSELKRKGTYIYKTKGYIFLLQKGLTTISKESTMEDELPSEVH